MPKGRLDRCGVASRSVDITEAVALASRVFAAYFVLQAVIAWILARRAQNWPAVVGFTAIALAMGTITIFGLSI